MNYNTPLIVIIMRADIESFLLLCFGEREIAISFFEIFSIFTLD